MKAAKISSVHQVQEQVFNLRVLEKYSSADDADNIDSKPFNLFYMCNLWMRLGLNKNLIQDKPVQGVLSRLLTFHLSPFTFYLSLGSSRGTA